MGTYCLGCVEKTKFLNSKKWCSYQCSHLADFFQQIGDLLEQGQIIFGNIVNKALENSTNLWKYDKYKIWAYTRLFRALGTIVFKII